MKSLFLLLLAAVLATAPAMAQSKSKIPHPKRKAAFTHNSESGSAKGKSNRARFRSDTHPVTLNLHPRDPERFAKARANKSYHFAKAGEVAKPRRRFKN